MVMLLAIVAWTSLMALATFVPLKLFGVLRVSEEIEDIGMDVSKHGGSAYTTVS